MPGCLTRLCPPAVKALAIRLGFCTTFPKPLLLMVAVSNMRTVWFELRQEPALGVVVISHHILRFLLPMYIAHD
jgi:hypothetical protein